MSFLPDDQIFIDIFAGEVATNVSDRPPTLKIRRLGPLVEIPGMPFKLWNSQAPFEVYASYPLRFGTC
jgi:hypothetical protein